MSEPTLGHLDPDFVAIMDKTTELLRYVFNTKNRLTIPISGTGSAGMEAALVNSVEPGDKAIICTCGVFGDRMVDVAERSGATVVRVDAPWGSPIDPEDVRAAVRKNPDAKMIGLVLAETSTGVLQPLDEIANLAHEKGMRIVVDLKKGAEPEVVVNQLYQYTPLQSTFSIINIALWGKQPRTLNLREMLQAYVEHRREVIRRRTMFLLRRARQRARSVKARSTSDGRLPCRPMLRGVCSSRPAPAWCLAAPARWRLSAPCRRKIGQRSFGAALSRASLGICSRPTAGWWL
jgi:hypothetical protein